MAYFSKKPASTVARQMTTITLGPFRGPELKRVFQALAFPPACFE
jgi:hypothetical protein